jgi:molecular chaperone GrpE
LTIETNTKDFSEKYRLMPDQETELKLLERHGHEPAVALEEPPNEKPVEPALLTSAEETPTKAQQEPLSKPQEDPLNKVQEPPSKMQEEPPSKTQEEPLSKAQEDPPTKAQFDQLKAERDQLHDRVARLQAEFENARKRAERERIADRDYATGNVVEKFLPVVDNFDLALKATGTPEQLRSGVELIVKQMDDILRQLQVTAIPALGEEFDPRLHDALGSVERDDLPDQHVAEEVRRGYKLRDKLLRPALVRVASNPKQKSE